MKHVESSLGMALIGAGTYLIAGLGPTFVVYGVLILIDRMTS